MRRLKRRGEWGLLAELHLWVTAAAAAASALAVPLAGHAIPCLVLTGCAIDTDSVLKEGVDKRLEAGLFAACGINWREPRSRWKIWTRPPQSTWHTLYQEFTHPHPCAPSLHIETGVSRPGVFQASARLPEAEQESHTS